MASTSRVKRRQKVSFGLSKDEIIRCSDAFHLAATLGLPFRWFLTLSPNDEDEATRRQTIRKFTSYLAVIAKQRAGAEKLFWLCVLEADQAGKNLHAHFLLHLPRKQGHKLEMLRRSKEFGPLVHIQPVYSSGITEYLRKQATPQAHYAFGRKFRREKGSHPIHGERVRLSTDLSWSMLDAGYDVPSRKYAKLPKPERCRPKAYISYQPDFLFTPATAPPVPVLKLVEDKRKELGISQRELAPRFGIGQAAYANAVRGHDKLGPWALNRALDFVADRLAA